jgi:drug/metabolite transporter (DMT)-like permease
MGVPQRICATVRAETGVSQPRPDSFRDLNPAYPIRLARFHRRVLAKGYIELNLSADGLTIGLILLSAVLHASWNALSKASGDPLISITIITATGGLCGLPLMIWFPLPGSETWKWLLLSGCIHYAYQLSLIRTYQLGDLSQVYPIARGLAPLGVACLAAFGAGEILEPGQILGLALAALAIISLGAARTAGASSRRAVWMAVLTALLIGSYTYSDGRGVRSVDHIATFIGWSFFIGSVPMVLTTIFLRGSKTIVGLRRHGLHSVAGGLMATFGYTIALWALSRAPMATVASLRESSVLFAAILGTRVLGESFGRRRIVSALVLVVGLVLVQTQRL